MGSGPYSYIIICQPLIWRNQTGKQNNLWKTIYDIWFQLYLRGGVGESVKGGIDGQNQSESNLVENFQL